MFALAVLGLSAYLEETYGPGHPNPLLGYTTFCGAASIFAAIIGLCAGFLNRLDSIKTLVLDSIACLLLLAGGIVSSCRILLDDTNEVI